MKRIGLKKSRKERSLYKAFAIVGLLLFCCQVLLAGSPATETWYPDAPYYNLKDQYESFLASEPGDISNLAEEFELALYLSGEYFDGWSNIFGEDVKGKDQYKKALKLYKHIVKYYPQNEYKAVMAKGEVSGLTLNLLRDSKSAALGYIDIFAIPKKEIMGSTEKRGNTPLDQADGKAQAQLDFEKFFKNHLRVRTIQVCLMCEEIDAYILLGQIIEKCQATDLEIVELAHMAKVELDEKLYGQYEIAY